MSVSKTTLRAAIALLFALSPVVAQANEIYAPVVNPISPQADDNVPDVRRVPGKHYTDSFDMTHVPTPHAVDPTRIGKWDGRGGARDGLRLSDFSDQFSNSMIDAQAQINDPLFDAVTKNETALVVSTQFDMMLGNDTSLAAERIGGGVETFATRRQIVDHNHPGGLLRDIDSVDIWGSENPNRAGFYSFQGDPGNTAVYTQQVLAPNSVVPYISTTDLAMALGEPNLEPFLDVDGLMVRDVGTGFNPFDGQFGPGDAIMFSLAPIMDPTGAIIYDGGEIWTWEFGSPAQFLDHGGHLWDTAFDVRGTFGSESENIDALEAVGGVPEPTSLLLGAMGLACLGISRRRRQ
ncbi:MAG: PEP-CTERM sorting domain-containing protein [Lacipirellulaceae bacterium]